jgi:AraC family ethanolamine operon transcriptional activator
MPPVQLLRQRFHDFDELAETVHGWGLDWVQLDRGPLDAAIHQISTPTAQLGRFRFSRKFHQRGTTPPGVRTFGLVGQRSPDVEWRGDTASAAHILAFPTNDLFEVVSRPGFHGETLSVSEDHIRSVAESMELPDPLEDIQNGLAFVEIGPTHQTHLRTAISSFHATVTTPGAAHPNPSTLVDVEFEAVSALVAALQSKTSANASPPESRLRARAVSSALDYIEAHADEPPSIEEICRASGASWRTLDYAFRDRFGVTPKQYLQATRLQRVRRSILNAAPRTSILEIAAHWGFWHMGQFAADYRRQFGELPSETIQRS